MALAALCMLDLPVRLHFFFLRHFMLIIITQTAANRKIMNPRPTTATTSRAERDHRQNICKQLTSCVKERGKYVQLTHHSHVSSSPSSLFQPHLTDTTGRAQILLIFCTTDHPLPAFGAGSLICLHLLSFSP